MLIEALTRDPLHYFSVVVVVMLSTVLHELAHAWAAIWEGDDTPRALGHLTSNPMVHMGPVSLVSLAVVGMAWGQCPINPRRFRHGRWGEAAVAAAGPAMNLALAALFALAWHGWVAAGISLASNPSFDENVSRFLGYAVSMNVRLALFNLLPLPPLDGYTVASLIPRFRDATGFLERQPTMGLFVALLLVDGFVSPASEPVIRLLLNF